MWAGDLSYLPRLFYISTVNSRPFRCTIKKSVDSVTIRSHLESELHGQNNFINEFGKSDIFLRQSTRVMGS